jgi:hypothetical protein
MTFGLEIGDERKALVSFSRNWFTGKLEIKIDSVLVAWASPLNPLTHFSITLTRAYSFYLWNDKNCEVIIAKVRPLLFAGFRPQSYFVFWKGAQIAQYKGY